MSSLLESSHPASPPSNHSANGASAQLPSSSPIQSYQLCRLVRGDRTELVIQAFDDRILVVLTQNGKVGCLTQASIPALTPLPPPDSSSYLSTTTTTTTTSSNALIILPPPPPSILLTPLLGTAPDPTLHDLYVGQIATLIWWTVQELSIPRRAVVVGLALSRKGTNTHTVKGEKGDKEKDDKEVQGEDDDDGFEDGQGQNERQRFMDIMNMVVSWPGPERARGAAEDSVD
ncbi:hypothetical protein BCR39DRAFT_519816 [Naematelia encephala]|uniref:Proteasome assembly chaperone 3 n=1 Tax=Naematelia encephala TaxID=71784 RepID=A0A1Y2BEY6_9TREE|nr:hypothetical protein BCR39DRAFT_519816 [Naematelia encephala]